MTLIVKGEEIKTDVEGFLLDPDDWTEEVGEALVQQHEADGHKKVTETGWMLIRYYREFYEEHLRHPKLNELIREHEKLEGKRYREEIDYKQKLYDMFPHGPVVMLAKLAGLPQRAVAEEIAAG